MKQRLLKLSSQIDALSLRERGALFAAAAAVILFLLYAVLLNPLDAQQAALRTQISQQRNNIAGIDQEITQQVQDYGQDPDVALRARLSVVNAEATKLSGQLRAVQRDLVAPNQVVPLLDAILKTHGRLRLLSLTTLPVSGLNEAAAGAAAALPPATLPSAPGVVSPGAPAAAAAAKPPELLYRHGVQLAVQGNYLDMLDYMAALEAMPAQLFWGKVTLDATQYPATTLTLTLYTLGLERTWITL
ncbi:MAG: type II secretion system protein M [Massilia sp.]|nr:type II secretion system protein M [Massilia sp.]